MIIIPEIKEDVFLREFHKRNGWEDGYACKFYCNMVTQLIEHVLKQMTLFTACLRWIQAVADWLSWWKEANLGLDNDCHCKKLRICLRYLWWLCWLKNSLCRPNHLISREKRNLVLFFRNLNVKTTSQKKWLINLFWRL